MENQENKLKFKKRYKEYGQTYYFENKSKILENSKRHYENNKQRIRKRNKDLHDSIEHYPFVIIDRCRQRARKKNIPFGLTVEDIVIPEVCPVFGFKLERCLGCPTSAYNSPSVDRIIPELGYVKGNIQIVSYKANAMKNNATKDELVLFANWILKDKLSKKP